MKTRIWLSLIFLLFISCSNSTKSSTFVIEGQLKNIPGGTKIYLKNLQFFPSKITQIDTVTLGENGSFEFKHIQSNQESVFLVEVKTTPSIEIFLINDAPKIKFSLDYQQQRPDSYPVYTVQHSPASSSIKNLIEQYVSAYEILAKKYRQYDSISHSPKVPDSIINAEKTKFDNELKNATAMLKNYVDTAANPVVVAQSLVMSERMIPPDQMESLATKASQRFPKYEPFQNLVNQYTQSGYPLLNKPAPDIALPTPKGDTISLKNFRGKYVLVDFWASWCGPCRQENPRIVAAYEKYKDKNFTILGVSLDKNKTNWQKAIAMDGLVWPQVSDLNYWNTPLVGLYHFDAIPFNVLVNPEGKIIAYGLRGYDLDKTLERYLQ